MPIIYHLSPDYFTNFNEERAGSLFGQVSRRVGERGFFFTTNMRDILKWVHPVAHSKGHQAGNKSKKQKRVNKEYDEDLRDSPIPAREDYYKTLFLYKVEIPHRVLREVRAHNYRWNQEIYNSENAGLWGPIGSWDAEIFVPAQYLSDLNIVGVKKYETKDLFDQVRYEENRPESKGYREHTELDIQKSVFEMKFKEGDCIILDEERYVLEGLQDRTVLLSSDQGQTEVDLLEFMNKASRCPDPLPGDNYWYKGARRQLLLKD